MTPILLADSLDIEWANVHPTVREYLEGWAAAGNPKPQDWTTPPTEPLQALFPLILGMNSSEVQAGAEQLVAGTDILQRSQALMLSPRLSDRTFALSWCQALEH
jgi:hypothetical protein